MCDVCSNQTNLLYTKRNTTICSMCGLEQKIPYDLSTQPHDWTKTPVITCYSRRKRFAKLFDHTISPYAENNDTKMIIYLSKSVREAGKFDSISAMIKRIKLSGLRDKRYGSIHVLSKLFLKNYQHPPQPKNLFYVRKRILLRFEEFEFAHKRYRSDNYFNYRWLLAKLMRELGLTEHLIFIKMLKCPIRSKHYEEMFTDLEEKLTHSPSRVMV